MNSFKIALIALKLAMLLFAVGCTDPKIAADDRMQEARAASIVAYLAAPPKPAFAPPDVIVPEPDPISTPEVDDGGDAAFTEVPFLTFAALKTELPAKGPEQTPEPKKKETPAPTPKVEAPDPRKCPGGKCNLPQPNRRRAPLRRFFGF